MESILRDADPLRHESNPAEDRYERIRRTIVATASEPGAAPSATRRAMLALPALAVVLIAVVIAGGYQVWSDGASTLQAAIRFEVRLAEDQPGPGLQQARVARSDRIIYVYPDVVVSNEDIVRTRVARGTGGANTFAIEAEFTAAAAQKMREATAGHLGGPVAILIDGDVVMAPVLRSAIGRQAVITGDFTEAQAAKIAEGIRMTRVE